MERAVARRRWNLAALAAATITAATTIGYVMLIRSQGNSPLAWVVIVLGIAAGLAGYAAYPSAHLRTAALATAAFILGVMGFLGIFSIGMPLLVAAVIAGASALVRRTAR